MSAPYAPVRWGIVSTAHINRLVIPPGQASPKVDIVAVGRDRERLDAGRADVEPDEGLHALGAEGGVHEFVRTDGVLAHLCLP